jgi:hypothetical protein
LISIAESTKNGRDWVVAVEHMRVSIAFSFRRQGSPPDGDLLRA